MLQKIKLFNKLKQQKKSTLLCEKITNQIFTVQDSIYVKEKLETSKYLWNSFGYLMNLLNFDNEKKLWTILCDLEIKGDILKAKEQKTNVNYFAIYQRYQKEEKFLRKFLNALSGSITV